jgi:hypothetical protein
MFVQNNLSTYSTFHDPENNVISSRNTKLPELDPFAIRSRDLGIPKTDTFLLFIVAMKNMTVTEASLFGELTNGPNRS